MVLFKSSRRLAAASSSVSGSLSGAEDLGCGDNDFSAPLRSILAASVLRVCFNEGEGDTEAVSSEPPLFVVFFILFCSLSSSDPFCLLCDRAESSRRSGVAVFRPPIMPNRRDVVDALDAVLDGGGPDCCSL